jgi:hypothetical protein
MRAQATLTPLAIDLSGQGTTIYDDKTLFSDAGNSDIQRQAALIIERFNQANVPAQNCNEWYGNMCHSPDTVSTRTNTRLAVLPSPLLGLIANFNHI